MPLKSFHKITSTNWQASSSSDKLYINIYNMRKQQLLHYPRLDTVLMVEEALKKAKAKDYPSKRQLWLSLPKRVMYQTFNLIL
jgi:hypothetical protein